MARTESRKHDRFRVALATVAVSAAFAGLLTYFITVLPDADGSTAPGVLRLAATWLAFTICSWRCSRPASGG
jgi:hypothetical protein